MHGEIINARELYLIKAHMCEYKGVYVCVEKKAHPRRE